MRRTMGAALAVSLLLGGIALGGPFAEFESQLRTAYGAYRGALFQTNKNDKAATEAALADLASKWAALSVRWAKAPPPQYADDPKFETTLEAVAATLRTAEAETRKGQLSSAHETLEKIRDDLGALRERNGVIVFSDRMNAYHAKMEHILGADYGGFDASGVGRLREDAAVLSHLFGEVAARPPVDGAGKPDFAQAMTAVKSSVEALLNAARSGDPAAAKRAIEGLKAPYSMLFLKFG